MNADKHRYKLFIFNIRVHLRSSVDELSFFFASFAFFADKMFL